MKRREFITLIGAGVAWPLAGRAQSGPMRRIAVLMNGAETDPTAQQYVAVFVQGLRDLGWIEGRNLRSVYRWSQGNAELARTQAAELVGLAPDVILTASTTNLTALQRLSPATPIVFTSVSDPVAQGFVLNLAHPGGNITGFTAYEFSIGGKWVDLLKQIAPATTRVAVVFNPQTAPQAKFFLSSVEAGAQTFGVSVAALHLRSVDEIEPAFENFARQPNVFSTDSFSVVHRKPIVEAAAKYRLPAIYPSTLFVRAGGLMRYGIDIDDQFRQAASYVDRILKGAKAGDLPVQTPEKYSLVINLKAAKALGIELPMSLMLSANEVIE
jgi:ABC-type uncharacterized transport system substrate-binding protein